MARRRHLLSRLAIASCLAFASCTAAHTQGERNARGSLKHVFGAMMIGAGAAAVAGTATGVALSDETPTYALFGGLLGAALLSGIGGYMLWSGSKDFTASDL